MNRKVSVAPMMDCTDRHERFFLRLISKNVLFYTEMIVSEAISRGDKKTIETEPATESAESENEDVSLDVLKDEEITSTEQEDSESTNS